VRHSALVVTLLATTSTLLVIAACASSTEATTDADAGDAEADAKRTTPGDSSTEPVDAGPTTCEVSRTYYAACKLDLNCADKFDQWCDANDKAINSEAFRRGVAQCLVPTNCDPDRRRDCEYKTYNTAIATNAQKQLVAAYCQTCEPSDTAGCATRATRYDTALGPGSVTDIFVAAWEFNDKLSDEMRTKCTGSALDAGADAGGDGGASAACVKAFAGCTADVYFAYLPDCP
jgi:hypothetical protein